MFGQKDATLWYFRVVKDEDVNIILEFENNSESPFTCLDGIVYPGTRFFY